MTLHMRPGQIEGINNCIKVIKCMAYGYRDTNYFFLKIRVSFPGHPRRTPQKKSGRPGGRPHVSTAVWKRAISCRCRRCNPTGSACPGRRSW